MLKNLFKKNKQILDFKQDYNLLSDAPLTINGKQSIKFGHLEIAKVATDLILKSSPPFTIGLFGKWGTGKTTIINLVKNHLKKQNIKTVVFDVWKYEADSLRRQFLITLEEELKKQGLDLKENYKETLNQSLVKPHSLPILEMFKILWRGSLIKILSIILILLIVCLFITSILKQSIHPLISFITNLSVITLFLGFVLESFRVVFGTVQYHKTDSAEGFEGIFYDKILPQIKDKFLIVIDNLDRTTHEKAVALLSDIKTFLSRDNDKNNKAIFLIACDEEAIKKHLEQSNFDDPAEFLRKFFNTSIRIPRFLGLDLDEYTRDLLKETKIDDFINNDNLEWLITYTFRDNPREIKQFINTLTSHYLLSRQMEEVKQVIVKGVITKKTDALAKFLIINQKFPYAFRYIEEMALSEVIEWNEIENEIKWRSDNFYDRKINYLEGKEKNIIMKEKKRFEEFIENTDPIDIPDISILVSFKQSKQEQRLVGIDRFLITCEDKKIEDARKIFNKFPDDKINYLDDILKSRIQKRKGEEKNKVKIWSMGASIIEIEDGHLRKLDKFLNELIINFPKENDLLRFIEDYSPIKIFDKLFPLIKNKNYQKEKIIQAYLSLFRLSSNQEPNMSPVPERYALELMNVIIKYKNSFIEHKYKEIVRGGLRDHFYTEQFLSLFLNNNLEKEFIIDKTKENFINSIKNEDLNDTKIISKKLNLLYKLNLKEISEKTIQKINELMQFEVQQGIRIEQRLLLGDSLNKFLSQKSIMDSMEEQQNKLTIETVSDTIVNWYNQDADSYNRLLYIRTMNKLKEIGGNDRKLSIEDRIRDFIANTINIEIMDKLSEQELDYFIDFHPQGFRVGIGRIPEIFDKIYNFLPQEIIDQVIIDFINNHPQIVPDKLKLIKYKVKDLIQIVSLMLDKQQNIEELSLREQYFESIARMRVGDDPSLTEQFYNVLLGLKAQRPEIVKKYSQKKFFNEAQKKALQDNL